MERTTQRSSAYGPSGAKSSLMSMPDWPYFLNLNGEAKAAPVLRSVRRFVRGSFLPWFFCRSGFGSKVSR